MWNDRRAIIHYLVALAIMSIYGSQVCPFIDSLSTSQQVIPLVVGLAVQFLMRGPLLRRLALEGLEEQRVSRVFQVEAGLFLATATAIMVFNALVYDFPLDSGLKVILGLGGLGYFAAVDLTLDAELALARHLREKGRNLEMSGDLFPLSTKLRLFATVSVVLVIGVFSLLLIKDLDWLEGVGTDVDLNQAILIVLAEFAFVGTVLLAYVFNAIRSFTRNLRFFFDNQAVVMADTTRGKLDSWIPVTTNDEFGQIARYTNEMVAKLRERTEELSRTRDVTIMSLASLAETRDNETGAHILRTQRYVRSLAQHLRNHAPFKAHLDDDETVELLFKSAPLHDIGKVGIPDHILLKPGRLTDEEFEIMKTHSALGSAALSDAEAHLGSSSFLRYAREIALNHHEKWDGSGYPAGLQGEQIPVSARLMAVADVYDALISKRVYKPAFPHEKALEILTEGRGRHFDPDVIDAFLAIEDRILVIAREHSDEAYGEIIREANPEADVA